MQLRQIFAQNFPGVEVIGTNYPPKPTNVAIGKLVNIGSLTTIATSLFGDKLFPLMGLEVPELVNSLQQNKVGACAGAWFIGNTVAQNLQSTGAFEVYYDGVRMYSKMETGRLPQIPALLAAIEDARKGGRWRGRDSIDTQAAT